MVDIAAIASGTPSKAERSANKIAGDFDNFLKLLTTQLQNQDPLEPLKTQEFTNQLVQFANVEQSIQSNQNLENLITLTKLSQQSSSLGYMGKTVEIVTNEFVYEGGDTRMSYYVPENASKTVIQLVDDKGDVIRTVDGKSTQGRQEFIWDGKNDSGVAMDTGDKFEIKLSVLGNNNAPLDGAFAAVYGTVTGVQFNGTDSELDMSGILHPMNLVVSISTPPVQQQANQ
jgi:flagellar basal-body rod modification protein FlgD